ncbi:hypothetical protein PLANPX_1292 [Lacipirellula parvula]|uniref:Uncharacterized protein n=1 Tax=Lacipirellula parvula TaxID=2650471 RepID=A0A5K7X564_9BACT|nr:hypothetical protein PLANPX_1292 [Lacipirellula parvula]
MIRYQLAPCLHPEKRLRAGANAPDDCKVAGILPALVHDFANCGK